MKTMRWATIGLAGLLFGCPLPHNGGDNGGNNGGSNGDGLTLDEVRAVAEQISRARVFGDGSMGTRRVSSDVRLGDDGDVNTQYVDFEVPEGVTLTVQSGTIIRCTGTFINRGAIIVQDGAEGGRRTHFSSSVNGVTQLPQAGIATLGAGAGPVTDDNQTALGGGVGAIGLSEFESRGRTFPTTLAGGGGAPALGDGGGGGGGFLILAGGDIRNEGTIQAPGADGQGGGGGGGGGQIILASRTRVIQTAAGMAMATGGNGGPATDNSAPGGGGGGGIVHFIAPEVQDSGQIVVDGGSPGEPGEEGSLTASIRSAGGGGGGSGGAGGNGGSVLVGPGGVGSPGSSDEGSTGFALVTEIDPTVLY